MDTFKVSIIGNHTQVEANCSLDNMAINVCVLTNSIYTAYLQNDPVAADYFKQLVQGLVADNNSPTWKPRKPHEGDITIVHNTYEEDDHA